MGNEKIFLGPIRPTFICGHETARQWQVDTATAFCLTAKELHDGHPDFSKLSCGIHRLTHVFVSFLLLPILAHVDMVEAAID